ncbi:hypothetical protein HDV05_000429, partial [Chytridiales sp. JEL 0842]
MNRKENMKVFVQHGNVEVDWARVKAKISKEEERERSRGAVKANFIEFGVPGIGSSKGDSSKFVEKFVKTQIIPAMQYRSLLTHARSLISKHHAFSTIPTSSTTTNTTSRPTSAPTPLAIDENLILQEYITSLSTDEKLDDAEKVFLEEVFLGCVRNEKLIHATLRVFYEMAGGRFLAKEYNLFAVMVYVVLFRLKDLATPILKSLAFSSEPSKMAKLLAFLFDSAHLLPPSSISEQQEEQQQQVEEGHGCLYTLWTQILDHEHVKSRFVQPLLERSEEIVGLIEDLKERAEKGMVPKKLVRGVTEPQPFLLTRPNPRKLPEPTIIRPTFPKARPVPKSIYETPPESKILAKVKQSNREKLEKNLAQAEKTQFTLLKRPTKPSKHKNPSSEDVLQSNSSTESTIPKPKPVPKFVKEGPKTEIKLTTAAILREDALVRKQRREEEKVLEEMELSLRDPKEFYAWQEGIKVKEEEESRLEKERR